VKSSIATRNTERISSQEVVPDAVTSVPLNAARRFNDLEPIAPRRQTAVMRVAVSQGLGIALVVDARKGGTSARRGQSGETRPL